jgi:hypothetical protein
MRLPRVGIGNSGCGAGVLDHVASASAAADLRAAHDATCNNRAQFRNGGPS